MQSEVKYIFVDLDRTLVRTDLFVESVLKLVKANPLRMFSLLIWILQGRSYVKDRVAAWSTSTWIIFPLKIS